MLQVHDSAKFNDDGTPRRKHDIDDTGPGRIGLRVAFGLALGSVISLVKNALALTSPPRDSNPEAAVGPADDVSARQLADSDDVTLSGVGDRYDNAADEPADSLSGSTASRPSIKLQGSNIFAASPAEAGQSVGMAAFDNFVSRLAEPARSYMPQESALAAAASGGSGGSAAQDVSALVGSSDRTPVNRRPVSLGLVSLGTVLLNAHLALAIADLLSKSDDPDGDRLTVVGLTASSGTLSMNSDGTWHYLPVYDDARPVVFRYQVSDGELVSSQEAVLTFNVPDLTAINGTTGHDDLLGTVGADSITAGDGEDLILARDGADIISGGDGADRIEAGDGDDVVWAGAGDDFVLGGRGNDVIYGEDGNDSIHGEDGNDLLVGGAGNDQLYGGDGNDVLMAGTGSDRLDDGAGSDVVNAEAGDDLIIATGGNDFIDGGEGQDTFDASALSAVTVNLSAGTADGADIGHDQIAAVENVATGAGDDIVTGSDQSNVITTGIGSDTAVAGGGADTVDLGEGDDVALVSADGARDIIDGGAGNADTLVVNTTVATGPTTVDLAAGTLSFDTGEQDTFSNFENVETGAGDDAVTGSDQSNVIATGAGNDTAAAGEGADTVDLGEGDDVALVSADGSRDIVDGGAGTADTLVVKAAAAMEPSTVDIEQDVVSTVASSASNDAGTGSNPSDAISGNTTPAAGEGVGSPSTAESPTADVADRATEPPVVIAINLEEGTLDFVGGEQDLIHNFENVQSLDVSTRVIGSDQANDIRTGVGRDIVAAGVGADNVDTGGADDIIQIVADGASDRFDGGDGAADVADLSAEVASVIVDLAAGEIRIGGEIDRINDIESVRSGSGNDRIIANDEQNDFWGGLGNDAFVFGSSRDIGNSESGRDRIWDFEAGDRIDIDDLFSEFEFGDNDPRDLRFTLLLGEDRVFERAGELRVNTFYDGFEGSPRMLILDGNLDRDEDAEFQIALSGDEDAIMDFLRDAFGRNVAEQI